MIINLLKPVIKLILNIKIIIMFLYNEILYIFKFKIFFNIKNKNRNN